MGVGVGMGVLVFCCYRGYVMSRLEDGWEIKEGLVSSSSQYFIILDLKPPYRTDDIK